MRPVCFVLSLLLAGVSSTPLSAQPTRLGGEFQINTYTTGDQFYSAVCRADSGDFVVVWENGGFYPVGAVTSEPSIRGQRFDSAGGKLGDEFQINTYTTTSNVFPDVACQGDGDFVVVWVGSTKDGINVLGRRFDSSGNGLGTEFVVGGGGGTYAGAGYTTYYRPLLYGGLSVAPGANGGFVVVWQSYYRFQATAPGTSSLSTVVGDDGDGAGVFGNVFDSTGTALGPEFQVNTYTTGNQSRPQVDSDSQGNFVVVWGSGPQLSNVATDGGGALFVQPGQDGDRFGVFGQRFDSSGGRVGTEFQVNTYTTGSQGGLFEQAVAVDADGDFVVVWENGYAPANIQGQRFSSTGLPAGSEFAASTFSTAWIDDLPTVAMDQDGDFVVAWARYQGYGGNNGEDVFARQFDSAGTALGGEFQVNTYTPYDQGFNVSSYGRLFGLLGSGPDIGSTPSGDFAVVWESGVVTVLGASDGGASGTMQVPIGQDGNGIGVFAQLYTVETVETPTPTATPTPTSTPTNTRPPIEVTPPVPGTGPVCGTADPNLGDKCLQVCSVGPDNQPNTNDDDCKLGTGGTDPNGHFCIDVMPPLVLGDRIFVRDVCGGSSSDVALVAGPAQAPALSTAALILALAALSLVALFAMGRRRAT